VIFDVNFGTYVCRGGKVSVKGSSKSRQLTDDEESEGLALLIPDIQETARIVSVAVHRILDKSSKFWLLCSLPCIIAMSSFVLS